MSLKRFCDVCGKEMDYSNDPVYELTIKCERDDREGEIVLDGLEGHEACIKPVEKMVEELLSKQRSE
jgi:hypothetical protein